MLKYLNLRDNSFSEIPHAVRTCVDLALIPNSQGCSRFSSFRNSKSLT